MDKYLSETELLNFGAEEIQNLIESRGWKSLGEEEKIKEIYGFVQNEIKFGYNAADNLTATQILKDGYGQCNTKATLLAALLRAVGVPCRVHASYVEKALQKGIVNCLFYRLAPEKVLHSWAEVYYKGEWLALEGVILDDGYLGNLQKFYFRCEGAFCGFGVSAEKFQAPEVEWSGKATYIQSKSVLEDLGVYDSPDELFAAQKQTFTGFKGFCYKLLVRHCMNKNVKHIRKMKVYTPTQLAESSAK